MFCFLCYTHVQSRTSTNINHWSHTSKAIHEIGSSLGISVLLTNFKVKASSSNSKVKIAPGGVHVPTIKWCNISECNVKLDGWSKYK